MDGRAIKNDEILEKYANNFSKSDRFFAKGKEKLRDIGEKY